MHPLKLRPLPSLRIEETSLEQSPQGEGFVDDSAVMAVLVGPPMTRQTVEQENLALAADDMDFAGWCLAESQTARFQDFSSRRAAPPELEEPGIGTPHRGSHRWWLAGFAGAFTAMLFSVLLVTLSSRTPLLPEDHPLTRIQKPAPPQAPKADAARTAPALTGVAELK